MNAPFVTPYDVETIRAEFPILSQQVYGRPLVYLDNAASAQKPRAVIDAMVRTMETGYSNVHRGLHYMANAATEGFEGAREDVRRFLNARSTDEIVFTKSATEGYNLVANSFGTMGLGEGDEIVLSIMEHHSNIVPWHFLRERKGAVIRWVPVDDDGNFLLDEYEKLFSPKTRMVAITHMSNVLGTVTPASEIVRIAHEHGVPVLLDGIVSVAEIVIVVTKFVLFLGDPEWTIWRTNWFINKIFVLGCFILLLGYLLVYARAQGRDAGRAALARQA
jgi:cysteine desulfurase/selenocysteine lyase